MPKIPFEKPALTVPEQITLLRGRGLTINDEASAASHLEYIGFYRLSGYMLPFQNDGRGKDRHLFKNDTSFEAMIDLYTFDRKLRLLFLDAIERIEIAIRTALSTSLSLQHGPHWYLESQHFERGFYHGEFIERAKKEIGHDELRRRDVFIQHYYDHYSYPFMPPSWMIFEVLSFGNVSTTIMRLAASERKKLANKFNIPEPAMKSWPLVLSYVRNLCAHHSRLWNRVFTIKPFIINRYAADLARNDRLYAQLVVAQIFMRNVSPASQWPNRLEALLAEYPDITPDRLAFPDDWRDRPVWR